jgi:hypothetical protein
MPDPPKFEETVAKLAMLAIAKGVSVDCLTEIINSGATMMDILRVLQTSKSREQLN